MLDHDYFMKQAIKLALQAAEADEVPIGAVVVADQTIIGKGFNQTRLLNDCTAHAEMIAITAACEHLGNPYLEDCTLYVTIEPCTMCAGALYWSRIGQVIYGASEPKFGFTRYTEPVLHKKTTLTGGVLADECSMIMQNFFREKRA
ncbi:MAG: nucleoside deaminase [Bacteroidetes bacterium]|nr:nucleoside deaminase [Bacteroidota bacterium]